MVARSGARPVKRPVDWSARCSSQRADSPSASTVSTSSTVRHSPSPSSAIVAV
jgi:hypothetical protein